MSDLIALVEVQALNRRFGRFQDWVEDQLRRRGRKGDPGAAGATGNKGDPGAAASSSSSSVRKSFQLWFKSGFTFPEGPSQLLLYGQTFAAICAERAGSITAITWQLPGGTLSAGTVTIDIYVGGVATGATIQGTSGASGRTTFAAGTYTFAAGALIDPRYTTSAGLNTGGGTVLLAGFETTDT